MKATEMLHHLGQSIWLDNITHELLDSGALGRYINDLSVTGLTMVKLNISSRNRQTRNMHQETTSRLRH